MEELKYAVGTPNGAGVGYFIAQHKPELGNRRVKRIEAFAADTQASGMRELQLRGNWRMWHQKPTEVLMTEGSRRIKVGAAIV